METKKNFYDKFEKSESFPLKIRQRGENVRRLQKLLHCGADGCFGIKTQHALEKAYGVKEVSEQMFNEIMGNQRELVWGRDDTFTWYDLKGLYLGFNEDYRKHLETEKFVYLILDEKTGKAYIGSYYSDREDKIRFDDYANTGHGGNIELKNIEFDYIKNNFKYCILKHFDKSTSSDAVLDKESEYKLFFNSRNKEYGYNRN